MPNADDVVRQWALWRTIGGKTIDDLARAMEREAPRMPVSDRERAVGEVWNATGVVLEKGGRSAAKAEGIDWASVDLTRKP